MFSKLCAKIISFGKKHFWVLSFLRGIRQFLSRIKYVVLFMHKNVDSKTVVFESFMGRSFSDSPKAIYNYMLNAPEYKDYKFVWFFRDTEKYKFLENNSNTKVVRFGSNTFLKCYATSKYWVTNSRISDTVIKKKSQVYLQCWHGTPLKKLGYDIDVAGGNAMNSLKQLKKKYDIDAVKYTYMVSPSSFCTERFISAFNLKKHGKENIILEKGYPRNDFLINATTNDIEKIRKSLNLLNDKKVILYAPTWRDNQHNVGLGYTYKTEVDFDLLKRELSDEYVIIFRAHYFVANSFDFDKYEGFVYDVSGYDDISELYVISDMLITDYSSVFFDYANLKRPIIFYMYDLEAYRDELRGFYFGLEELPGNIVKTETELIEEIRNTENFTFDEKYKSFNDKFNYLDDGKATERVVENFLDKD